jgi:fatty-acyl-CoA synthase
MKIKGAEVSSARQHALGDLPRRTARRSPSKTAIVDNGLTLTYSELDTTVDRLAAGLQRRGLSHGDRLAILSHNCWQYVVTSFATARLGVILVPINFMLNAQEISYILSHCEPAALIAESALAPTAADAICALATPIPHVCQIGHMQPGWPSFEDWLGEADYAREVVPVADDDPIRLMYTSGTESRPKGALLTSRSLLWQYVSCCIDGGMDTSDVDLHAMPLYHCAQMDCFLGPDIYLGATSVITGSPEPGSVLSLMERHQVTKFFAPPTIWISLLRHPDFDRTDLSRLRKGYYGASAMPVEILREIGDRLPEVRLWNFYGQTEMAPLATILGPEDQRRFPGSAGRPSVNVETLVVDDDDNPLPAGEVGEIVHRSPQATLGYYKDPAKTAEAFRNGWFHSGDLGTFDEHGLLRVVDRKKDMIKTGGENVSSREVEEILFQHSGVAEAAVFGVPDPRWVEAVAAAIVPREGARVTAEDIMAYARRHLAGYKCPKHVFVVSELPKNPSGKILKRVLRDQYVGQLATGPADAAALPLR